jgi:predicted adenylyl cyclase CyaB
VAGTSNLKRRKEIQTRLDSGRAAHDLLLACGLEWVVTFEKRRASYRLGTCRIELDRAPLIGRFVEIEGPSEKAIDRVRRKLGIEEEHVPDAYLHLICRHLGKQDLSSEEVTFQRFPD